MKLMTNCTCMHYSSGDISSNCRNCGMPPNPLAHNPHSYKRENYEQQTKSKLYTEEEVRRIVSKAWLIHPNPENMLEDFDKWFNKNKK